ncbi:MAG: serpin family protein [Myxococcales bacterium]
MLRSFAAVVLLSLWGACANPIKVGSSSGCTADSQCASGQYCELPLAACPDQVVGSGDLIATGPGSCHRNCDNGACICQDDQDCPGGSCQQGTCNVRHVGCSPFNCTAECPPTDLAEGCEACLCAVCPASTGSSGTGTTGGSTGGSTSGTSGSGGSSGGSTSASSGCTADSQCAGGQYCELPLAACPDQVVGSGDLIATGPGICHRNCDNGACICQNDQDCPGGSCQQGTCKVGGVGCSPFNCTAECPPTDLAESCEACLCAVCPASTSSTLWPTNCGAPPVPDAGLVAALVAGDNQFASNLLGQLAGAADGGNLFFSPFSVSAALGMTYAGAVGQTASQIAQALQFPTDAQDLAPAFGALDCQLTGDGLGPDGGVLTVANALFGQQDAGFQAPFLSLLQTAYGAPLQPVDFAGAPDTARQTIDQWVAAETAGNIPELLQPGSVTPDLKIVLVDALYFHGLWATAFNPLFTSNQMFHIGASGVVQVPMMSADPYPAGYYKGPTFALLEVPFDGVQVAMDFLLPDQVDGLPALEASLTPANLAGWLGNLVVQNVQVSLPKLSLDTRTNLIPAMQALGMTLPFTGGADFSGMDGQQDISLVLLLQEAVLQMDEAGVTAAAATAVGGGGGVPPQVPSFDAAQPFLLLIRDLPTGSVLFVGQVTNPTAS